MVSLTNEKNKLKEIFKSGKSAVNGWLQIPNSFTAELMANQDWDSLTLDMQHGVIDYANAVGMLQAISQQMLFQWLELIGTNLAK